MSYFVLGIIASGVIACLCWKIYSSRKSSPTGWKTMELKECDEPLVTPSGVVCRTVYETKEDFTPTIGELGNIEYKCILFWDGNFLVPRPVRPCSGGVKLLYGCKKCAAKTEELYRMNQTFNPEIHAVCPDGLPVRSLLGFITKEEYAKMPPHPCDHRQVKTSVLNCEDCPNP